MKYEFHVGDYVETKDGDVGYIEKICDCECCKVRGFYEPYICYKDGSADYITFSQKDSLDTYFKRIGQYDFTKQSEDKIKPLNYTEQNLRETSSGAILYNYMKKINELVDAVNKMREEN